MAESDDLARVVDVLLVVLSAGHSIHNAVALACPAAGSGPVARLLSEVAEDTARGAGLLESLGDRTAGAQGGTRALLVALSAAVRSGSPVAPALQRIGDSERVRTHRRTQERVRRLPVTLLGPLVLLVLPAFVLLAIVPVLVTVARSGLAPVST